MRLRAAFFDVGGTLIGWSSGDDPWRPVVMKAIEREFGSRSSAEALYAADIRRPPADDPYRQETNRWLAEWLTSNAETLTDSEVERLRMAFAAPLDRGPELLPGAADALRWCKCQRLSDVIDHVVSSHSTGWMKPHPAMYRRALALAGVAASEAFMIGDQLEDDVAGAKAVGIRAVWKRPASVAAPTAFDVRPDAVVASLYDLQAIVEPWLRE